MNTYGGSACGDSFLTRIQKQGKNCNILNFDDTNSIPQLGISKGEFNKKFANTMGVISDIIENEHSTSLFSLLFSTILGNVLYTVFLIVAIILLIYFIFKWVIDTIKQKLSRYENAINLIYRIWDVVSGVIKKTLDAIKNAIDAIKKWFENFNVGKMIKNAAKSAGDFVEDHLCFWC